MDLLEKEIEEIIWNGLIGNNGLMHEKGFVISDYYLRQPDLGSYGRPDIVGITRHVGSRDITITVYELKRDCINIDTLMQSLRYCKGIERYIAENFNFSTRDFIYEIVLIGKSLDTNSSFVHFPDFFPRITLQTYSICFHSGIQFKSHTNFTLSVEKIPSFTEEMKDDLVGQIKYVNYCKNA